MSNELSLENMRYFEQIQERVTKINRQLKQMSEFSHDRQKKYETCLKSYEKYVAKQNQVMLNNIKHSQHRNKFFLEEVKKAWQNGISNRQIVLRSLARTNIIKRDADEWIARMEDQVMGPYQNSLNHQNNQISQSQLIQKYNQIVRQYNAR